MADQPPRYPYHTPGMPQYNIDRSRPSQLQTGGSLGGMVGGVVGGLFGGKAGGTAAPGFEAANIQPLYPTAPAAAAPAAAPKGTGGKGKSAGGGFVAPKANYFPTGMGAGMGQNAPSAVGSGPGSARTPQRQGWTVFNGSRSTNNAPARTTGDWLGNSSGRQAAADTARMMPRTSGQQAKDPNDWAGIARDLGNAGVQGYQQWKTGGVASTGAKNYARGQTAAAFVPGAQATNQKSPTGRPVWSAGATQPTPLLKRTARGGPSKLS